MFAERLLCFKLKYTISTVFFPLEINSGNLFQIISHCNIENKVEMNLYHSEGTTGRVENMPVYHILGDSSQPADLTLEHLPFSDNLEHLLGCCSTPNISTLLMFTVL